MNNIWYSYFVLENSEMVICSFCQEIGFHHKLSSFQIRHLEELNVGLCSALREPSRASPGQNTACVCIYKYVPFSLF